MTTEITSIKYTLIAALTAIPFILWFYHTLSKQEGRDSFLKTLLIIITFTLCESIIFKVMFG